MPAPPPATTGNDPAAGDQHHRFIFALNCGTSVSISLFTSFQVSTSRHMAGMAQYRLSRWVGQRLRGNPLG